MSLNPSHFYLKLLQHPDRPGTVVSGSRFPLEMLQALGSPGLSFSRVARTNSKLWFMSETHRACLEYRHLDDAWRAEKLARLEGGLAEVVSGGLITRVVVYDTATKSVVCWGFTDDEVAILVSYDMPGK